MSRWRSKILTCATALALGFSSVLVYSCYCSWRLQPDIVLLPSVAGFDWDKLEPRRKLEWADCYSGYQCARFKVPLDYSDVDGESAVLALIRIPSPFISSGSSDYRGPVIFNPGGPGGDGVGAMLIFGKALSTVVGPHFDLVSFDPRGVGRTTPLVTFFETDAERESWAPWAFPNLNISADVIPNAWAHAQIMGRLAEERDRGAARHVTTDVVARDMLQITQAYGRGKIQYWGFSYGTILGVTFAAMFPDYIERLIIDGVADAEDYFAIHWKTALLDTDKVLQTFFSECASAGPAGCHFYAPTAQAVSQRLSALYESVRARPVAVRTATSYGIVDYTMMRLVIFTSLYAPYDAFPLLAKALSDLEAGDGATMFGLTGIQNFECRCDREPMSFPDNNFEVQTAILCSDASEVHDSPEELDAYYQNLANVSSWADIIGSLRMRCSGWRIRAGDHFTGPFTGNTSHPILLIGNTADPVTPLSSAHKMSKGFPGSVVLTQNSAGHCSFSGPSLCTMKRIRQYFENGTLPEPGTVCPVDFPPFLNDSSTRALREAIGQDDRELLEAARHISRSFKAPLFRI